MAVITGGKVIAGQTTNPGLKNRIYKAEAIPTDTNIGYDGTPPNGTLAENVVTGFVYEKSGAGVWTRIDTV